MKTTYQTKPKLEIKVDLPSTIGIGYGAFWRSRNFYRVVKGSRGSKKSKTTALNFIVRLLKYPWANLLVIRRYSNTNKQSTYTDFKWACNQLKVTHLFKFNESLPEITVKATGQKILFRGLDDELKITSITVDVGALCWAWFEEAYQIETEDKFSTVVESIRGSLD
ncbi:TPA: phage terminase large subunit, partial [Streptococcus pyogenes]